MTTCAAVWCGWDAVARGLCKRCYDRYRRGISPISPTKRHALAEDKARLHDEITLRREAGQSIADIAAAVGVNTSTASRWLREWEVEVGQREDARAANLWRPRARDDIEFLRGLRVRPHLDAETFGPVALVDVFKWAHNAYKAADELWVTPEVLEDRLRVLHPHERRLLALIGAARHG